MYGPIFVTKEALGRHLETVHWMKRNAATRLSQTQYYAELKREIAYDIKELKADKVKTINQRDESKLELKEIKKKAERSGIAEVKGKIVAKNIAIDKLIQGQREIEMDKEIESSGMQATNIPQTENIFLSNSSLECTRQIPKTPSIENIIVSLNKSSTSEIVTREKSVKPESVQIKTMSLQIKTLEAEIEVPKGSKEARVTKLAKQEVKLEDSELKLKSKNTKLKIDLETSEAQTIELKKQIEFYAHQCGEIELRAKRKIEGQKLDFEDKTEVLAEEKRALIREQNTFDAKLTVLKARYFEDQKSNQERIEKLEEENQILETKNTRLTMEHSQMNDTLSEMIGKQAKDSKELQKTESRLLEKNQSQYESYIKLLLAQIERYDSRTLESLFGSKIDKALSQQIENEKNLLTEKFKSIQQSKSAAEVELKQAKAEKMDLLAKNKQYEEKIDQLMKCQDLVSKELREFREEFEKEYSKESSEKDKEIVKLYQRVKAICKNMLNTQTNIEEKEEKLKSIEITKMDLEQRLDQASKDRKELIQEQKKLQKHLSKVIDAAVFSIKKYSECVDQLEKLLHEKENKHSKIAHKMGLNERESEMQLSTLKSMLVQKECEFQELHKKYSKLELENNRLKVRSPELGVKVEKSGQLGQEHLKESHNCELTPSECDKHENVYSQDDASFSTQKLNCLSHTSGKPCSTNFACPNCSSKPIRSKDFSFLTSSHQQSMLLSSVDECRNIKEEVLTECNSNVAQKDLEGKQNEIEQLRSKVENYKALHEKMRSVQEQYEIENLMLRQKLEQSYLKQTKTKNKPGIINEGRTQKTFAGEIREKMVPNSNDTTAEINSDIEIIRESFRKDQDHKAIIKQDLEKTLPIIGDHKDNQTLKEDFMAPQIEMHLNTAFISDDISMDSTARKKDLASLEKILEKTIVSPSTEQDQTKEPTEQQTSSILPPAKLQHHSDLLTAGRQMAHEEYGCYGEEQYHHTMNHPEMIRQSSIKDNIATRTDRYARNTTSRRQASTDAPAEVKIKYNIATPPDKYAKDTTSGRQTSSDAPVPKMKDIAILLGNETAFGSTSERTSVEATNSKWSNNIITDPRFIFARDKTGTAFVNLASSTVHLPSRAKLLAIRRLSNASANKFVPIVSDDSSDSEESIHLEDLLEEEHIRRMNLYGERSSKPNHNNKRSGFVISMLRAFARKFCMPSRKGDEKSMCKEDEEHNIRSAKEALPYSFHKTEAVSDAQTMHNVPAHSSLSNSNGVLNGKTVSNSLNKNQALEVQTPVYLFKKIQRPNPINVVVSTAKTKQRDSDAPKKTKDKSFTNGSNSPLTDFNIYTEKRHEKMLQDKQVEIQDANNLNKPSDTKTDENTAKSNSTIPLEGNEDGPTTSTRRRNLNAPKKPKRNFAVGSYKPPKDEDINWEEYDKKIELVIARQQQREYEITNKSSDSKTEKQTTPNNRTSLDRSENEPKTSYRTQKKSVDLYMKRKRRHEEIENDTKLDNKTTTSNGLHNKRYNSRQHKEEEYESHSKYKRVYLTIHRRI